MDQSKQGSDTQAGAAAAIQVAIQLALIAGLAIWCFRIFSPFFMPVLWGAIIAVALYPFFLKIRGALRGRNKLAATLFTVVTLVLVIGPTYFIAASLVETAQDLTKQLSADTLVVPPPPEPVREWPLIGRPTYDSWLLASQNLSAAVSKFEPQLRAVGGKMIGFISGVGGAVVQSLLAIIVAGLFLGTAQTCVGAMRALGRSIGGTLGAGAVDMAAGTIRSVAQGVIGVALIQALMAAIGLFLVGVPAAGLWTIVVMVLAIVQLPPILVLLPIALYVFSTADSTVVAVIFLVWSVIVSGSDAFLKPLFLGRGLSIPMPVILIGAIGGMMLHGMIGLFVGAIVLAMGYTLVDEWLKLGDDGQSTVDSTGAKS